MDRLRRVLTKRREQTELLRLACVTAIGSGVDSSLRRSFPLAPASSECNALIDNLKGVL